jgi:hypothetical protein
LTFGGEVGRSGSGAGELGSLVGGRDIGISTGEGEGGWEAGESRYRSWSGETDSRRVLSLFTESRFMPRDANRVFCSPEIRGGR